jgi:molybdate transport system substrate-binding protein
LNKTTIKTLIVATIAAVCSVFPAAADNSGGKQVVIEAWHADSLAGPMSELKKAFEAKNGDIKINLTSGRSKELAERILGGEACDVFAPSDPAVVKDMFTKKVGGQQAASWYITFSANEMVVIAAKGSPLGIGKMTDLEGVRLVRVTGEKDMATYRTLDFINKAAAAEGKAALGPQLIDGTAVKAGTIPEAVQAVKAGEADAGVVYLSAAVAAGDAVAIVYFPAAVNLSQAIRNVVTVPATAGEPAAAARFVKFMLSAEGQAILKKTGQPPVVPPLVDGAVPAGIM